MVERETILIVDDEKSWQRTLSYKLEKKGRTLQAVSSAEEALEALQAGGVTRVISDGLEGDWEEVYKLAQEAGIPLTVFSGSGDVQKRAQKLGVRFIDKMDLALGKVTIDEL